LLGPSDVIYALSVDNSHTLSVKAHHTLLLSLSARIFKRPKMNAFETAPYAVNHGDMVNLTLEGQPI
jgi:hypothetical protein